MHAPAAYDLAITKSRTAAANTMVLTAARQTRRATSVPVFTEVLDGNRLSVHILQGTTTVMGEVGEKRRGSSD